MALADSALLLRVFVARAAAHQLRWVQLAMKARYHVARAAVHWLHSVQSKLQAGRNAARPEAPHRQAAQHSHHWLVDQARGAKRATLLRPPVTPTRGGRLSLELGSGDRVAKQARYRWGYLSERRERTLPSYGHISYKMYGWAGFPYHSLGK